MNRLSETLSACVRKLETLHARHDADAGVILVQVDQMARINNSAGTAAGDSVLDEIGRRLENFASDEFGQGSCVDRLDGPRFLIGRKNAPCMSRWPNRSSATRTADCRSASRRR